MALSATVSNAEEVAAWMQTVRGETEAIIEERRPGRARAPVHGRASGAPSSLHLLPTFVDDGGELRPNPVAARLDGRGPARGARARRPRCYKPWRTEVVERLADERMLPAIVFVFSRAGCDQAVEQCLDGGIRLTDSAERVALRRIADAHLEALDDADLDVLGYDSWIAGLEAGVAAHHAGMVPPMKEAVEEAFLAGLLKVVFATETLSLGINMPARSVVVEKLSKFTGEHHELLTPGEYTQLAGRAGRRGIDDVGYAVVLWDPFVAFEQVAGLASRRTYALTSSFRATYNMAANLVQRYERDEARRLLDLSFAQYHADRDAVSLTRQLERTQAQLARARDAAQHPDGDIEEYRALLAGLDEARRVAHAAQASRLDKLRPGDVVMAPEARRAGGRAQAGTRPLGQPGARARPSSARWCAGRPTTSRARSGASRTSSCPGRSRPGARASSAPRSALLRRLPDYRASDDDADARVEDLQARVHAPPAARRAGHRRRAAGRLAGRPHRAGGRPPRAPDRGPDRDTRPPVRPGARGVRVVGVRATTGSCSRAGSSCRGSTPSATSWSPSRCAPACSTASIPPALTAVVSCFVYQRRGPDSDDPMPPRRWPAPAVRQRVGQIERIWKDLSLTERDQRLRETRRPDPGFTAAIHAWADGDDLADILEDEEMTGGDFVRNVKQVIDLLRQLAEVAPEPETAATARAAADQCRRGVVAASSIVSVPADRRTDAMIRPGEPWGSPTTERRPTVEVAGGDADARGRGRRRAGRRSCASAPTTTQRPRPGGRAPARARRRPGRDRAARATPSGSSPTASPRRATCACSARRPTGSAGRRRHADFEVAVDGDGGSRAGPRRS